MQLTLPLQFRPPKRKLNTHLDAVVYAFEKMDAGMLHTLLKDELTYECLAKNRFLEIVDDILVSMQNRGDDYLIAEPGFCNHLHCNYLKHGYRFTGEHSTDYFDMIFEEKDGQVFDIYHCSKFCTNSGKPPKGKITSTWEFMNEYEKQAAIDDLMRSGDDL